MKKLLVVLAALLLVAGFAVTAMAADPVKFSGEFDYTLMGSTNGGVDGFANFYTDITMTVDEMNTIVLELAGKTLEGMWYVDPAVWKLTSDLGAAFDLPIGVKNTAGRFALDSRKFEVSGHAYERPVRPGVSLGDDLQADFSGKAILDVGFGVDNLGALLLIPEVGPASIEAYYMAKNRSDIKGWAGGNVKVLDIADMVSVAGMFAFNMGDDDDDATADEFMYGAGVSLKYNIAKLGVSFNGNDLDAFNQLGVDLEAKFTDLIGATAAFGMCFAEDADAFQGADLSVFVTPGKATWRVGYIITENGYGYGDNIAAENQPIDGGLYLSAGIDF